MENDERRATPRSKWRWFYPGLALYPLLVIVQANLLEPDMFALPLMILVALVPVVWALLAWIEVLRSRDELQRRIHTEAATFSVGITGALSISYGFLESYAGQPTISMFWAWGVIGAGFLVRPGPRGECG